MWIDSHCHLNHPGIKEKGTPSEIIQTAKNAGVDGMLTICCRMSEEIDDLRTIAGAHDNVWYTIGTHPHDAALEAEKPFTQSEIVKIVQSDDNIIGIGETGLDYYYDNAPRKQQQESFRKHIRAAIEANVPLIVHTRDAEEDTAAIMKEEGQGTALSGVMHCFSASQNLAETALDMGFYISFSGIVTFKKAEELREIATPVTLDKILVETDAPFLAPVPFRGKPNEPAFVTKTGEYLADLLNIPPEDFAKITSENFFQLFKKAQKTQQ